MTKSSAKHAKYCTGKGVEGKKLHIETCDLSRIQSKVRGPNYIWLALSKPEYLSLVHKAKTHSS